MFRRLRAAAGGWVEDQAGQMGAALAYYTLFSLTPLLILALLMLGMMFNEAESRRHLLEHLRGFLDQDGARAVESMLDNFLVQRNRASASLIGLFSLLFGATGMFTSLRSSLRTIWRLKHDEDGVFTSVAKTYLIAILMILVVCAFFVVLLLVSAGMAVLATNQIAEIPPYLRGGPAIDLAVSIFVLMLLFVFGFRFLSDGRIPYLKLFSGAFVSAVLFSIGKLLIGLYLAYVNLASLYGAAGSLVVFLAWVYYSAQIIFFGAEVIRFGLPSAAPAPLTPARP